MKLRLLLFALLLSAGIANAQQDTIKTLIISEALSFRADASYVELTNVGTEPVQLANFKIGMLGPYQGNYFTGTNEAWLPEKLLQPGESFTLASVYDFTEKMYPKDPDHYGQRVTPKEYWEWADWQIHQPETNGIPGLDSVSPVYNFMVTWNGRDGWYLEQHLSETDSVVVDQVGGFFDNSGHNFDKAYDVAGVTGATNTCILVRKNSVKQGNTTFVYGVGEDDSEWIPIPLPKADMTPWRSPYWTWGNHGNYKLDANTLQSSTLSVDFAAKKITAPWGTRRLDDFMRQFTKKPGLGWNYHFSLATEDSAYVSARTGDQITIYACGDKAEVATFDIVLSAPASNANIVLPKYRTQANGYYDRNNIINGNYEAFKVTVGAPGMDSITNGLFGIPYATNVDSLMKYLEKAPKANWEIVWVDGLKRTGVKSGDILRVTAENGAKKDYYIKTDKYRPNHVAELSAITWPDIPESLKGIYGWTGDTIPNFSPNVYNYNLQVPADVDGIPALVAKTQQLNAKIEVKRAASLQGSPEQRTITFTVTAEDDTTQRVYSIILSKEKNPDDIQPFVAEPFISEIVFQDMWANGFVEICNPGNQVLDLSNYMLVCDWSGTPAGAVTGSSGVSDWGIRYTKYVPGMKWVTEANWAVTPGVLEQDINVSPLVFPGDVFVGGQITGGSTWGWSNPSVDPRPRTDVFLNSPENPWGETYTNWSSAVHQWVGANYYLFKIVNDSVKLGLKSAIDPNDFVLVDVFGNGDGSAWVVAGVSGFGGFQCSNFIRKPGISKGNPTYGASFGTNTDDSEWQVRNPAYWEARNVGWPNNILNDTKDIGQHYLNEITYYKSTVSSVVYKVSEGYGKDGKIENIKGMKTGTTVSEFLSNIIKADEKQSLNVMGVSGALAGNAVLNGTDTLVVISADSTNTTRYLLQVSAEGLSSNAVLTSSKYTVTVEQQPKSATEEAVAGAGNIKGFDYGTALKTILANVNVPAGATLTIIDGDGAYVPLKTLNFDTTYVNVTVNSDIYLDVLAEDGKTSIIYQLIPTTSEDEAFITSDIYAVSQKDQLINYVPRGTNVATFIAYLVPNAGSTIKLVDKLGQERIDGVVADDDKVVVTSASKKVTKVYYVAKLRTEFIQEPTYLAYILSNIYTIDQVDFKVFNVSGTELVSSFLSKVTASQGATAIIIDKNGNQKTTGDINGGDMVKVTSADGKVIAFYTFGPLTAASMIDANNIEIYPNPTNDIVNISGVKVGNRIQVYSTVGTLVKEINVQNSTERVSLRNQPTGIYMIIVSDNNTIVTRFKAVKQ